MPRRLILASIAAAVALSPALAQLLPLGPEFQVNTYTTSYQNPSSVAMDPAGGFVIVWSSNGQDDSGTGVFCRRYDSAGSPLGGEFQVNTYTTGDQFAPNVAMDLSGDFVVVWASLGQDGSGSGVFGQRYDSTGAPLGGEFQASTFTTNDQVLPMLSTDPAGNFVVVWQSLGQDGSYWGVFGRRYDSAGSPLGGEFQVNTYTTSYQFAPAVAMDSTGSFAVAWESYGQDGSVWGILGRRYDSEGAPLGGEFQVNTYTTGYQKLPALAMDPAGGFAVVWDSPGQDGSGYGVFVRRYDSSGAPLGGDLQVNAYTSVDQFAPTVAMDLSGNFVVVWASLGQDGSGTGVFGRRFDSSGAPLGEEFQANTHTLSDQFLPVVSIDKSGSLVVTWTSLGQDGSSSGIFGRRFCPDTDADALCDAEDIVVTSPVDGDTLDCRDPRVLRPAIAWDAGNYEKFRVFIGTDPSFAAGTRITSGDTLISSTVWTPPRKKWRAACNKAQAVNPSSPVLYVKVFGVDGDVPKSDPYRKTFSQVVQAAVQP